MSNGTRVASVFPTNVPHLLSTRETSRLENMKRLTNQGRHKRLSVHLDSAAAWYPLEVPCRPEDVLRASVDRFSNTQVDTFVCHVAVEVFAYWGIEQWVGDPTAYPNRGTTQYRLRENLRQLTESGQDPIALMRDACRAHGMDFYLGNRTNEIHHGA